MEQTILNVQKIGFQWSMENPFLFCAHHLDFYPEGNGEMGPAVSLAGRELGNDFSGKDGFSMYYGKQVPGFPVHPHRGFETVTIVLEGLVDHFDSKGSEGRYGKGDVQWMTAGSGCQHVEMFPLVHQDKKNPLELFQVWLNLPAKDKFTEPDYKMLWAEDIPKIIEKDPTGKETHITMISGIWKGTKSLSPNSASWAFDPNHHVNILHLQMEPFAELILPTISSQTKRNLYFYRGGKIQINGLFIDQSSRIKLNGNQETVVTNGEKTSYLLLLEGDPIEEPVVQYGPFVMNTEKEIKTAFQDFRRNGFGGWPWKNPDQVHVPNTPRFARHANGKVETK
jgi:hypothetical protein